MADWNPAKEMRESMESFIVKADSPLKAFSEKVLSEQAAKAKITDPVREKVAAIVAKASDEEIVRIGASLGVSTPSQTT